MGKFAVYIIFRCLVAVFSVLPFGAIYFIADGVAWLLHRVLKYRRQVIVDNLQTCYPSLTANELESLLQDTYQNIADILVEAIKGFSMTQSAFDKRYTYVDTNLGDGSCILMGSHLCNWEWGVITWPLAFNKRVVGIYKPLSNTYIEQFTAKKRSQFGHVLASMYDTRAAFDKYSDNNTVFVMLSDQNPTDPSRADWVTFLGRDTACVQGADRYARRYRLPVYYFETIRLKRGYYRTTCELLCFDTSATEKGAITKLFMDRLDNGITANTADWLWSHRRWKHKRSI